MITKHQHLDWQGKVILERIAFKTPLSQATSMPDEACIVYNVKGNATLYGATETEQLQGQECVLMRCGNYFTRSIDTSREEDTEVIAIHFYPAILKEVFAHDMPELFSVPSASSSRLTSLERINVHKVLENYFQNLLFYFENPSLVTEPLIALKLKEIILLLINTDTKDAANIKSILGNVFTPSQVNFKEVIEAHLFDSLTVEELALLTGMSVSSFKRKFKEMYQSSPATYIKQQKLERVAYLLRNTNLAISTICYEVGFSDTSNFTKTFSAYYGCTPSMYRKREVD